MPLSPVCQVRNAGVVQRFILIHVLNGRFAGWEELSGVAKGMLIPRNIYGLSKPTVEVTNPCASEACPGAVCVIAVLNSYQGWKDLPSVWIYATG